MANNLLDNKILFPGKVISNQDPLFLGRLRVFDKSGKHWEDVLNRVEAIYRNNDDIKPEYQWVKGIDPFVYNSLLPVRLHSIPQEKEYVNLIYMNKSVEFQDQYYIQPPPSQITNIGFDEYDSFVAQTNLGDQNKPAPDLKNSDGKTDPLSEGVFPEPDDTALLGRGSCDIVIKDRISQGESSILLRAAKCEPLISMQKPVPYNKRAFIQISDFATKFSLPENYNFTSVSVDEKSIKYLIEWNILNLDNQFEQFILNLRVYELAPKAEFTTSAFNENTELGSYAKVLNDYTFYNKSIKEVIKLTNKLIQGFRAGNWNLPNYPKATISDQFPFAFRANPLTYKWREDITSPQGINLNLMYPFIKLTPVSLQSGFGLAPNNNEEGVPTKTEDKKSQITTPTASRSTSLIQAADKVYILSHDSKIDDKGIVDLSNSIYGLTSAQIASSIYPKTEPMVRGDQLVKMLNLITKFLIAHVHPFHGVPPVPTSSDGTTVADILSELQKAPTNMLNQNIRIN